MTYEKIIAILSVVLLLGGTAWAGNIPEFDAVGCDAMNFFAVANLAQHAPVIRANFAMDGRQVNVWSTFPQEDFHTTAGQLLPDPCFHFLGHGPYLSALTDVWNEAVYEWRIVLQMKPESDINLNIYDCVLKHNGFNIFFDAEQTGRYRADWGQPFFVPSANPSISAAAEPGPFATPGFVTPFIMDARTLPGMDIVPLDDQLYTSKAHWDEGMVLVLPETGSINTSGQTVFNLKQGDRIRVRVTIPGNNTADIRYGPDSVMLKYIGIVGTWYLAGDPCLIIPPPLPPDS